MNKKPIFDTYLVIAVVVLVASLLIWKVHPPDVLKSLESYRLWIPLVSLIIAAPIAFIVGKNRPINGFLVPAVRSVLVLSIIGLAVWRAALGSPSVSPSWNFDDPRIQPLLRAAKTNAVGFVSVPPANMVQPPSPIPTALTDVTPVTTPDGIGRGLTNGPDRQAVKAIAQQFHDSAQDNKGNPKAADYLAQAAAAAAALYIMNEIPPPANTVVAKMVGNLLASLFGGGKLDPGEAILVSQLVQAAMTGDPSQIKNVLANSDVAIKALNHLSEELPKEISKYPELAEKLKESGIKIDPEQISQLISDQVKGFDPAKIEASLREKFTDPDQAQKIIDLITTQLPAHSVPKIMTDLGDNLKFGKDLIDAVSSGDRLVQSYPEKRRLLQVMIDQWNKDPKNATNKQLLEDSKVALGVQ